MEQYVLLNAIISEQYVPTQVFWNKKFYINYVMSKFNERLKELRLEEGLTRAELAQKVTVSVRLVSYWESGQRECSFDVLITLAEILHTSIDYLLGRVDC